jgi:hypothetical protein
MTASAPSIPEMLETAAKLRRFARATAIPKYQATFRRAADAIELEAMGHAASDTVIRTLSEARARPRVERLPC